MGTHEGWTPEFPGQRPPFAPGNDYRFEEGNKAALTHGADSAELVAKDAQGIVQRVLADPELGYLHRPTFAPTLTRYARLRARADRFARALEQHADTGCMHCERCESLDERWQKAETTAGRAAEKLGLDPLSRARLLNLLAETTAAESRHEEAGARLKDLIDATREIHSTIVVQDPAGAP